jgi:predicted DNA-binding transcriptional regulator AlpA
LLLSLPEVIDLTGLSDSHIRREMATGLPSRYQAGRRRFIKQDVLNWFNLPGADTPAQPAKSWQATRWSDDARELPPSALNTSKRSAA